jgi:tetratricopeptide (TPR) repeat protein
MSPKLYIFLTIVITLCLLPACSRVDSSEAPAIKLSPEEIKASITIADALFKQREDVNKLQEAVNVLGKARNWQQPYFEVEWRFAELNYFLGKQTKDLKQAEAIFTRGRDAGKTAAGLQPTRVEGHFWYGANLGELGRMDPMTVGIRSAGDIRSAMNKVIEIDPTYQLSSAYDALAVVELETKLAGGSAQKASEIIEKALATEHNNFNLHLHLATAYLSLGKDAEARKNLEHVLQMKPDPNFVIEYRECAEQARKMLDTKF